MVRICPFCGNHPKLHTANKLFYVICENCGCMTQGFWKGDDALICWNQRKVTDLWLSQLREKDNEIFELKNKLEVLEKQQRIENNEADIFDFAQDLEVRNE